MANNKTTYVLEIDAELGALEKKLNSIQGLMSGVMNSAQAPKGLDKSFEKLGNLIEKIRQKASQPIDSKGGFTSIGKDINAANTALNGMLKIIKSIDSMSESAKISFLPPEAQEQLEAIVKSLTDYASAIDAATTETAELVKARNELAKAEENISKAQSKVESRKNLLDEAKAEKETTKQSIEAIKQRKEKLAELRKEQEKIEKFYNTIGEDGNKPNRSKKYDGVSMRPQDIKRKIVELENASAGDAEELSKLQENYKKASNNVTSYINQLSAAERALKDSETAHGDLTEKVNSLEQAFKQASIEKQEVAFRQLREEAKKLGVNLEDIDESFSDANADALIQKFVELKQKGLDPLNEATDRAEMNARQMGDALDYTRKKTDEASDAFEQITDAARQQEAFENKIKQFLGLAGAAQVMRHALRDAMQTISELDKTMTEMSVVTDLSVGDYWDQLPQYTKRANELGLAINDVYKADTLYYQQGLKTNEVVAISTETMKMAQIAGLDTAEATDRMTAALRGFNMELDETNAKRISDVYSELAAITAADVDEISTAMTKTASIASSAGMEFETTAAFLSQIIETTRESAETAGTAMKTVIARFQELKKAPDEIGEIDGEIVDANAIETALRSVGVELRDAGGQFRELDDVFLELSSKWDGLDKNTQRYIATIAAGSRQQSRFIAMMSDYARTQELVTSANNSAGASNKQFEKTAESLRFKVNQLKNAWHEFTMGIMESDLVKMGVDILTKFLEIVNKATNAFDGLGGSLAKITSLLAIFKLGQKIFDKFKQPLLNIFSWAAEMAGLKGYETGKRYAQEVERGAREAISQQAPESSDGPQQAGQSSEMPGVKEKKSFKQKALEKTGVTQFKSGFRASREKRNEIMKKKQAQKERYEAAATNFEDVAQNFTPDTEEYQKAMEELVESDKEWQGSLKLTKEELGEVRQAGIDGAEDVKIGMQKMGETAMAAGVGISMLGGLLSSLGLEEVGEGLSIVGNVLTFVGTGISLLGSLIPAVASVAVSAGISVQAAWWWLALIVAVIGAAIIGIIALAKALKNATPEAQLEQAQKAAEKAAEAAEEATNAYEELADALGSLEDKYEALEELTRGTKEWNAAIREINNSVLDLIEKYPELAKFVENVDGVLTIDTQGEGAQQVLKQAEAKQVITKNQSIMANLAVAQKEDKVEYDKLTTKGVIFGGYNKTEVDALAEKISSGEIITEEQVRQQVEEYYKKWLNTDDLSSYKDSIEYETNLIMNNSKELRDYGDSIHETKLQQESAYGAIASAAQGLANTLNMTESQIKQSQNLVDEDLVGKYYQDEKDRLDKKDKNGIVADETVKKAIQEQYGEGATVSTDGTIKDRKGEVLDKLSLDQVRAMTATYKASLEAASAIENSDEAIQKVAAGVGTQIGNETLGQNAVNAMYMSRNGGALTQEDLQILSPDNINFDDIWNSMSDGEKAAYGNDISRLKKDFQDAVDSATGEFDKAGDAVRKFMTADMAKGFSNKLNEIAELAGGEEAKAEVQSLTDKLLGLEDWTVDEFGNKVDPIYSDRFTQSQRQQIQSRINMTDWSNQEQLLALQIDLQQQYGFSADEAKEYVDVLGKAAYATSGLTTTVRVFGELWKATEKINQSIKRLTKLQWEYDRALEGKGGNIESLVGSMLSEYRLQAQQYQTAYGASNDDLAKIYAQGGLNYKVDLREFVQLGTDGVKVDNIKLQDAIDSGKVSEDEANEWLEKINNQYATSQEQIDGLRNTLENIEELEQQGEDAFYELRSMAKDTILVAMQEQIDLQRETLEATREANAQLISKIQEQIDEARQERANEEAEKNIANLQSQQAYLGMDTSGANALQMLNTNKEIANAEQDYQDSLVDQAIQNLQDANAKAEEQRDRQITIAENQLEQYEKSVEFQQNVDEQLKEMLNGGTDWENSTLGSMMRDQLSGMSASEIATWTTEIGNKVQMANTWQETNWPEEKTNLQAAIGGIEATLSSLPDNIMASAEKKKLESQRTQLKGAGFNDNEIDKMSAENMDKLSAFTKREDSGGTLTATSQKLKDAGISVDSKEEYYKKNMEKILAGELVATYEEFLTDKLSKGKTTVIDNAKAAAKDNKTGLSGFKQNAKYNEYLKNYQALGGTQADFDASLQASFKDVASGHFPNNSGVTKWKKLNDNWYQATVKINGESAGTVGVPRHATSNFQADAKADEAIRSFSDGATPQNGWVAMYEGEPYIYNGNWHRVVNGHSIESLNTGYSTLKDKMKNYLTTFKTGGIADFTGPAWLDGTKSRPEYILNAAQTERFFSLVDILEKYEPNEKSGKSGDNYFEIEINVEKLENDYDVEKVADKIRRMIYEDASYRNVNAINHIR